MPEPREILVDWLRSEFAAEQRNGFSRLERIPDSRVVRFLDHFAALSPAQQTDFAQILAEWSSYRFFDEPLPHAIYERFARATAFPDRAQGIRYMGVKLLAGLAKDPGFGGLQGWQLAQGITGMATEPPKNLLPAVADLIPIKIPILRKLVRAALGELFAEQATDMSSGYWLYDGELAGRPLRVQIRYCDKLITPQLRYSVDLRRQDRDVPLPEFNFELILGAGFGSWDYVTEENAGRSVALLCELVQFVARLPDRLPAGVWPNG